MSRELSTSGLATRTSEILLATSYATRKPCKTASSLLYKVQNKSRSVSTLLARVLVSLAERRRRDATPSVAQLPAAAAAADADADAPSAVKVPEEEALGLGDGGL